MSNQIQDIDLSKAYVGQYIKLRNGEKYRIGNIHTSGLSFIISSYCNKLSAAYKLDGKDKDGESDFDIVEIQDSSEVKLIKVQSKVDTLEWALKYVSNPSERRRLFSKIDELKASIVLLIAECHGN